MSKPLPDFADPPVVEVVLSVQFEPVTGLRTPQLGLLWQHFRDRFPITQDHAPIEPAIERFGVAGVPKGVAKIEMLQSPPVPRCWFLNESGTELIQVQQDRFIYNWRKVGEKDEYGRYKQVKGTFASELERFRDFLERERLGDLNPNQCEVTYVNHIAAGDVWRAHSELGEILSVFNTRYSDGFLGLPEDARLRVRYVIPDAAGQPLGRLHISVEPVYRVADGQPMFRMDLTARGRPVGEHIDGVLRFLDIGRDWVVRGFTSITTSKMHSVWGRRDDR